MTEHDWLSCRSWDGWEEMWKHSRYRGSRKNGLFGVACCRGVWHLLTERARWAVEVAERYADGQASKSEWYKASSEADEARGAVDIPEEAYDTASEHERDVLAAHVAVCHLTECTTTDFV